MFKTWFQLFFILLLLGFLVLSQINLTLRKKARMILWCYSELIIESMMPNFNHIFPVCYYSILYWLFKEKYSLFGLSFMANVCLFLIHADHNWWHFWFSHNCRKLSPWCIFTRKTRFTITWAIVDYDWYFLIHQSYKFEILINKYHSIIKVNYILKYRYNKISNLTIKNLL